MGELTLLLELPLSNLSFFDSNDPGLITAGFEKFKELVSKQRRILAAKYHPDKGGDIEKMKTINNAADMLINLNLKIKVRQPDPTVIFRQNIESILHWGSLFTAGATDNNTATDFNNDFFNSF